MRIIVSHTEHCVVVVCKASLRLIRRMVLSDRECRVLLEVCQEESYMASEVMYRYNDRDNLHCHSYILDIVYLVS